MGSTVVGTAEDYVPANIPGAGRVTAIALSLITTSVIVACFCRVGERRRQNNQLTGAGWRLAVKQEWGAIPLTKWRKYA